MFHIYWTEYSSIPSKMPGHHIKKSALAEILHDLGFSLHVNKKTIEGKSHADRDAQFAHINSTSKQFEQKGAPIVSVDCKKKGLIGNFKNNGREWQAKGEQTRYQKMVAKLWECALSRPERVADHR